MAEPHTTRIMSEIFNTFSIILATRPTRTAHLLLRRQLLYPDELVSLAVSVTNPLRLSGNI